MEFTRSALTSLARPIIIVCADNQGKALLERSASVTLDNTSRARGPAIIAGNTVLVHSRGLLLRSHVTSLTGPRSPESVAPAFLLRPIRLRPSLSELRHTDGWDGESRTSSPRPTGTCDGCAAMARAHTRKSLAGQTCRSPHHILLTLHARNPLIRKADTNDHDSSV